MVHCTDQSLLCCILSGYWLVIWDGHYIVHVCIVVVIVATAQNEITMDEPPEKTTPPPQVDKSVPPTGERSRLRRSVSAKRAGSKDRCASTVLLFCIINQLKEVLSKILRGTLCKFYKLCCKEKCIIHKLTSSPLIWYQIYWL